MCWDMGGKGLLYPTANLESGIVFAVFRHVG